MGPTVSKIMLQLNFYVIIFDEAKVEGVSEEKLKFVHAPIREKINSNKPEEIAISIAAEIINETIL